MNPYDSNSSKPENANVRLGYTYYPAYASEYGYNYGDEVTNIIDDRISSLKAIVNQIQFIFFKKWWIIAITTIFMLSTVLVYTFQIAKETYVASSTFFIYRKTDGATTISSELSLGEQLVKDSLYLIKTYDVSQMAINRMQSDNKPSPGALRGNITSAAEPGTRIFRVSVTGPTAADARDYTDAVAGAFVEYFGEIIGAGNYGQVDFVHIIDHARTPSKPVSPNIPVNIAISLFIGLLIGAAIIFVSELLDNKIRTPDKLKMSAMIDIIGVITVFDNP